MGYDATNILNEKANIKDVSDYLVLLGYKKIGSNRYSFYSEEEHRYLYGVYCETSVDDQGMINVWTRTLIYCSYYDLEFHNYTIRQLRKTFGGKFYSDNGTNRYFINYKVPRIGSEAGCFKYYEGFSESISKLTLYLDMIKESKSKFEHLPVEYIGYEHPNIIAVNLLLPYIVTLLEEYFRSTYVVLLQYSDRKQQIFKNNRPHSDDLLKVSNGEISIEEAIARSMSFQNIAKIINTYRELSSKLTLSPILKKPYRRRKENLYDTLERVFEARHALIHWKQVELDYSVEQVQKDTETIKIAIRRIYDQIVEIHNWTKYD